MGFPGCVVLQPYSFLSPLPFLHPREWALLFGQVGGNEVLFGCTLPSLSSLSPCSHFTLGLERGSLSEWPRIQRGLGAGGGWRAWLLTVTQVLGPAISQGPAYGWVLSSSSTLLSLNPGLASDGQPQAPWASPLLQACSFCFAFCPPASSLPWPPLSSSRVAGTEFLTYYP